MAQNFNIRLKYHILITLLSPALGAYSLFKTKNTRLIIWIGAILFAILGSLYVYIPGTDGHSHRDTVKMEYLGMSFVDFFQKFIGLLSFQDVGLGSVSDPYIHILGFLSVGLFGVPDLLHVFASFIYGLVYFKAITLVFKDIRFDHFKTTLYLLITVFLIYRGVTGLNSIRWWTAFWIFFLAIIGYAHTGSRKYVLLGLLSPFIHFSFLAIGLPALIAYFFRRKQKLILIAWVFSFFLGSSYNFIQPYIPNLDVVQKKERYVLNEEIINNREALRTESTANFYVRYGEGFFRDYSIVLLAGLLFFVGMRSTHTDNTFLILFTSGIALYTFGNLMDFSPAVSGRSKAGASVLIMAASIRYVGVVYSYMMSRNSRKIIQYVVYIFFSLSIPLVIFQLSYAINMVSAFAIFLPFISWIMGEDDFTIREFIASLL